jgi:hypothetical protein
MASVILGAAGGAVGMAFANPFLGYALATGGSLLGGLIDNAAYGEIRVRADAERMLPDAPGAASSKSLSKS